MGGHVSVISSSFYKDSSSTGLRPSLMTSFNLIISLKALSPNTVTLGVRAWTCEFERGHNSVHNKGSVTSVEPDHKN